MTSIPQLSLASVSVLQTFGKNKLFLCSHSTKARGIGILVWSLESNLPSVLWHRAASRTFSKCPTLQRCESDGYLAATPMTEEIATKPAEVPSTSQPDVSSSSTCIRGSWDAMLQLVCFSSQLRLSSLGNLNRACASWSPIPKAAIRDNQRNILRHAVLTPIQRISQLARSVQRRHSGSQSRRNIPRKVLQHGMNIRIDNQDRYWAGCGAFLEALEQTHALRTVDMAVGPALSPLSEDDQIDVLLNLLQRNAESLCSSMRPRFLGSCDPGNVAEWACHWQDSVVTVSKYEGFRVLDRILMQMVYTNNFKGGNLSLAHSLVYRMCTQKNGNHTKAVYEYYENCVKTMSVAGLIHSKACRSACRLIFKYLDRYQVPRFNLPSTAEIWAQEVSLCT